VLLAAAGAVAFGVTRLTLSQNVHAKEVFQPGKPVSTSQKPVRLSRADRREIGRTMVAFVRDGVAQGNLTAAYDLVTPAFRGGTTRAQWGKGASPVYVYPAVTRGIAGNWRVDYSYRDDVGVALMLSSTRPRKVGQIIFHAELYRRGGSWLVDSFAPVATFTPIGVGRQHETGPADFTGEFTNRGLLAKGGSQRPLDHRPGRSARARPARSARLLARLAAAQSSRRPSVRGRGDEDAAAAAGAPQLVAKLP